MFLWPAFSQLEARVSFLQRWKTHLFSILQASLMSLLAIPCCPLRCTSCDREPELYGKGCLGKKGGKSICVVWLNCFQTCWKSSAVISCSKVLANLGCLHGTWSVQVYLQLAMLKWLPGPRNWMGFALNVKVTSEKGTAFKLSMKHVPESRGIGFVCMCMCVLARLAFLFWVITIIGNCSRGKLI